MDHRISKDMISSGLTPSGEKNQADLGKTQYGSAPSPSKLMDAYKSMYDKKEEVINEHHKKDADGNTIPHEDDVKEGKIPAGLQAYLDKKKGKKKDDDGDEKKDKKDMKDDVDLFDLVSTKLIEEGYSEKESYEIMSNLTEEQLNEFIVSGSIAALGALKGAALATKGALVAGKAAAMKAGAGAMKASLGKVKAIASTAPKKGLAFLAKQGSGRQGLKNVATAYKNPTMGNVRKVAGDVFDGTTKLKFKSDVARSFLPKGDGDATNKISKTGRRTPVTTGESADLFDIVKGQLLDEGLSEEEIRDIMLSLTPDEIMEELSDIVKRNDAINKAKAMERAKQNQVPQKIRDASKRQMKAGTPREDPNNPYTTQDKKDIINYNKDK